MSFVANFTAVITSCTDGALSARSNNDVAAVDQLFEASCQFAFGSIKSILITGQKSQFLAGDHLMGYGIQINLNQRHRSTPSIHNPGKAEQKASVGIGSQ